MEERNGAEQEKDLQILQDIEEKVLEKIDLGFDLQALEILEREDTRRSEIEALRDQLSQEIVVRLFSLGNSIYFGRLRAGRISNFFEVIMRLGTERAKVYILSFAVFFIHPEKEFMTLAARSFLNAFLAKILAKQMGATEEEIKKVELGCLLLEIGKVFMLLYARQSSEGLPEEFISRHHSKLGIRVIEKFELPAFLKESLAGFRLNFKEDFLAASSMVHLAHLAVDHSFRQWGRLILESPMPDAEGVLVSTMGSQLREQMEAVGLGNYLEIIPQLSLRQQIQQLKSSPSSPRPLANGAPRASR